MTQIIQNKFSSICENKYKHNLDPSLNCLNEESVKLKPKSKTSKPPIPKQSEKLEEKKKQEIE